MIINNKYFSPPPKNHGDFKNLLNHAIISGVGRHADNDGKPLSAWTPELLMQALSEINSASGGADIRSVRYWFNDNDKGANPGNIRDLAIIFGCGDPDLIFEWRRELTTANARLASKRLSLRREQKTLGPPKRISLASRTDSLFSSRAILNLPITVWAGCVCLGVMAYILGSHDVIYSPRPEISKQVGYFWSPNWTIQQILFMPFFIITVSRLLTLWKHDVRSSLILSDDTEIKDGWELKLNSYNFAFWLILLLPFLVVFCMQWLGIYLPALLYLDAGSVWVDWILIAISKPDISIHAAITVSFFAYLYSSMTFWFLLAGHLFLHMIASDFSHVVSSTDLKKSSVPLSKVLEVGQTISNSVFKCAVLGILTATCIKLNGLYLASDAENIISWLIDDARVVVGFTEGRVGWISLNPLQNFTSFILVFLTCFVFFTCQTYVYWSTASLINHIQSDVQ